MRTINTKPNPAFSKAPLKFATRRRIEAVGHAVALCAMIVSFLSPARAETLVIPGSGNPEYILRELARAYNSQQNQHRVIVPPTIGTAGAIREVSAETATLGRVGRPLKDKELSLGLTYRPIGRDPVAFVGGASVTATGLSPQQAIDIFTGKITNWRDLGGKPETIRAVGREVTDASRQTIMKEIRAFEDMKYHDGVKIVLLDTQLIELLDRYPASFGFLNRSQLSAARTDLKLLALDGVEPTADNVKEGRYKLWTELGLIYKESALTEAGRSFIAFIESPRGKELLRAHGLLLAAPDATGH